MRPMSDRANYAILSGDTLDVYYAAWGGPTIQRELKDGPAACERFIRAQEHEPDGQLLEFAFMEGGIALDMDRRRAMFFGGPGEVNYVPAVQARLVERLRPVWARDGWTIAWARRYAHDLVAFLGLPGTCIENPAYLEYPGDWETVVAAPLEWVSTLVARRLADRWDIRASQTSANGLMHHGPQLAGAFTELPAPGPLDAHAAANLTALLLDEDRRSLVIVAPLFASLNAPHWLAERAREVFPGWSVELDLDLTTPYERLRDRGLPLARSEDDEEHRPASLTEAELDEIVDRALTYAPEAEINALIAARDAFLADLAAQAEADGQTVVILDNTSRRTPDSHDDT